ncbi:hypothetical protein V6N13_019782 [Hibiscus sabdariffa]
MSAFRKAQAKGTRIGFLKWSAQSSERRSGHQVKAQKHRRKLSSRCNLSKVRRAGESNGGSPVTSSSQRVRSSYRGIEEVVIAPVE